jgi:hypothetical protein
VDESKVIQEGVDFSLFLGEVGEVIGLIVIVIVIVTIAVVGRGGRSGLSIRMASVGKGIVVAVMITITILVVASIVESTHLNERYWMNNNNRMLYLEL